ncbi:ParB N-terminal domain-containing protein [Kribbella sp. DT2]|uniref:ParB/RepB/Spo0J family partition protein n=1 Tax=Kribbella sp. DT2 TaxID=3393427 RepID=UPI003CEDA65A
MPIELSRLSPGVVLRRVGVDEDYAVRLADSDAEFAPVLVQRESLRIVDGLHRWRAAHLRGSAQILAILVDDDDEEAFLRAVRANGAHGLPLEPADRKAAAAGIIAIRPDWSDRAVGREVGLSAKVVGVIRRADRRASARTARRGLDGRVRPINAAAGRRMATEILERRPDASLREVARSAGISASTVRDVKARLERGEDPVQPRQATTRAKNRSTGASSMPEDRAPGALLDSLMRDPSLRYTEAGRTVLSSFRLQADLIEGQAVHGLPALSLQRIAELSRRNAVRWGDIANSAFGSQDRTG